MPHIAVCLFLLLLPCEPPPELEVHLEDVAWMPSRDMIREQRWLAASWRDQIQACLAVDPAREEELTEALSWARHCFRAWDACEDAQLSHFDEEWRMQALEKLRDEIGPSAYLAGRLPRVYERFARID